MALTYFTVTGYYDAAAQGLDSYDTSTNPAAQPLSGVVEFVPMVTQGDSLQITSATPPSNTLLAPVRAAIVHGVLVPPTGTGSVRLVANTSALNLNGDLVYQVWYPTPLKAANGEVFQLKPFYFQAPTSDVTVDMTALTPVPGQTATGTTLGPVGPQGPAGPTGPPGPTTWSGLSGIPANLAYTDTAQTLTNKTLSGASNTLTNIGNSALTNSAITIAGNTAALGSTVTQDQITGLSSTGLVKRTAANTLAVAAAGTDYAPPTSGTSLLKANGSGGFTAASSSSDYVPWYSGTGGVLPATSGQHLTTQGGNTLDDGAGNVVVKGGALDGVTIGATTPATAITTKALNSPASASIAITSGTAQGVWLDQSTVIFGTNSSTSGSANFLSFADQVNNTSSAAFNGLLVNSYITSPAKGGRIGINSQITIASVGSGGGNGYAAVSGGVITAANLGGTSSSAVGQFWGGWFTAGTTGGTYHYSISGLEVDVFCNSSGTQQKKGIRICLGTIATDTVRGTRDDTALQIIQDAGSVGFGIGIKLGTDQSNIATDISSFWPFTNTSTIIGTCAVGNGLPANIGIDFSSVTFSDCAIKTGPAPIQMGGMASAPATPASGKGKLYIASDGSLHYLGASGTDTRLAVA